MKKKQITIGYTDYGGYRHTYHIDKPKVEKDYLYQAMIDDDIILESSMKKHTWNKIKRIFFWLLLGVTLFVLCTNKWV